MFQKGFVLSYQHIDVCGVLRVNTYLSARSPPTGVPVWEGCTVLQKRCPCVLALGQEGSFSSLSLIEGGDPWALTRLIFIELEDFT